MFEWSDTDLIMRDTIRGFIDKEIRPNLDALETELARGKRERRLHAPDNRTQDNERSGNTA